MITFYHGTTTAALEKIKREGLIPRAGKGGIDFAKIKNLPIAAVDESEERQKSVYLTTHPLQAVEFADTYVKPVAGGEPIALAVRLPVSEVGKVELDEHWALLSHERYGNGFRYPGVIKPRWVKGVAVKTRD